MQRYTIRVLLVVVLIVAVLAASFQPIMVGAASAVGVAVNNKTVVSVTSPVYYNGSILVAAKEFAEAMGGSFSYDENAMTGTIRLGEDEVVYRLDNSVAKYNGKYIQAPVPMRVEGYRFVIPAEFTARQLGAEVYMKTSSNLLMIFQPVDNKLVYQVVSGDTLWVISNLFGTTVSSIKQLNGLTTDTIYVGQKLIIKNMSTFDIAVDAVTPGSATLRSGAGFEYNAISYLQAGTAISVVGKLGDWYKVITPKGNGYMYYSVISVKQAISDTAASSTFFEGNIPVDTSADYVTYTSYTIQRGDNLWSISEKYGILDFELAQANNMSTSTTLYAGQVLKIPVHNIPVKSKAGTQAGEVLDWFKEAQYVFPIGAVGKFIDIETGKSFMAKRTMGANHSDTETLTPADSQAMKDIFGGWNWNRRPFILETNGRRIAISVAGMPHAGVDGAAYLQNVDGRSDNWGYGPNYDRIPGNGMDGHFDVYFLNSIRHKDNLVDSAHQYRVMLAGGLQ